MTHTDAIRAQIIELENEVRKDPRVAAIQHLKAALAALEGTQVAPLAPPPPTRNDAPSRPYAQAEPRAPRTAPQAPRQESKIMRIRDVVGQYIDDNGPTHRSILVEALNRAGLNEGVKNPLTALATSMHTLKEFFVSDGQGTFRRRESVPSDVHGGHQGSPQGEAGGVAPPADLQINPNDTRAAENGTEAGGT